MISLQTHIIPQWLRAYRLRRLVGGALMTYVVSLGASLVLVAFFGLNPVMRAMNEPDLTIWLASFSTISLIAYGATKWYLRDIRIEANVREGLFFGASLMVCGIALDMITVIPHAFVTASTSIFTFYSKPFFLLTVVAILIAAALAGLMEETVRNKASR